MTPIFYDRSTPLAGTATISIPDGLYADRYHVDHRCGDLESSCKEFREAIDQTVTDVDDSLISCRQEQSRVEDDESSFAAVVLQTTEQIRLCTLCHRYAMM